MNKNIIKWRILYLNYKKSFDYIINSNKYVINCKSNKQKNIDSLSYLIEMKMSQSDCIKLGIGLESILIDYILCNTPNIINIKEKNKSGCPETDHLFKDNKKKIIYYSELKSNLKLDTEKTSATIEKCLYIKNKLAEKYIGYEIKMFLIGLRYYEKNVIPKNILYKYKKISENIIGINEYLKIFNICKCFESEKEYKQILNILANKMFK